MNNQQIVKYAREVVVFNLEKREFIKDMMLIMSDDTNQLLLEHINGLINLFMKAKEIIERECEKDVEND